MSTYTEDNSRFFNLGNAKRIFAISAIHGDISRLQPLHDKIFGHISAGDRIVYTGNYIGYGDHSVEVLDEILTFRRAVLAKPAIIPSDLVYLRGSQEEMWQKLLQMQFAPNPLKTYMWMLGNGLSSTLQSYGFCQHEGLQACQQGMVGLMQWTSKLRSAFKARPGHDVFATHLVRAAYMPQSSDYPMLFVNAGIDVEKPLEEQGDNFWWSHSKFNEISEPYKPFQKIIRGYDPTHKGVEYNCTKATIDGGCGFGGQLVCAVFNNGGTVLDTLAC